MCNIDDTYPDKVDSTILPGSLNITGFYFKSDATNLAAKMPGNTFNFQ